jgi:cyanophycinase
MKRISLCRVVAVAVVLLSFGAGLFAAPSHGPKKGTLLITGGITQRRDYERFIAMAGGVNARIVVIPSAIITAPLSAAEMEKFCIDPTTFGGTQCTVLHTTDRAVADSESFVSPLKEATGVWLMGGRQWRLVDTYLGTRTVAELFKVLDRGAVIGGASAGASIQASFLVRGQSSPDDNHVMMSPGHEIGFGFLTNSAIDQHVDARERENDLAVVIKAHPELLGIGIDQSTSITVRGDTITVNGPGRVAIWDGKEHDGKGYYQLHTGDSFDTVTRVATIAPVAEPAK